ncbi:Isoquinoline 1-oxidoreductase alpha subunit [Candidatus Rhodobacter oscarellae]|uniref:Isoquinoline 1-oxidoreductase alpha subunit n=1 Tax=Candidatus Rhodobacter oscarellae TaxID=1675527 RepID=A0A0J9EBR4_9RHOB|nr:(2Fe-2S)-binding protein [Candidatus Rhodobacter lobularis]KMW60086.1 Isoquinoline 1-oxidoreductase alpha subunit [Candidatus Rhodobacter lobularis]
MATTITVNQTERSLISSEETPLLWVLRDELKLTGTKYGCGVAQCGACTVMLDGQPVRSCQVAIGDIAGSDVTTIEAVSGVEADAVRQAWVEMDVVQCGFCQSGQVVQAIGLLELNPEPTDGDIDTYMGGNVCRCATYVRVRKAIHRAAEILAA